MTGHSIMRQVAQGEPACAYPAARQRYAPQWRRNDGAPPSVPVHKPCTHTHTHTHTVRRRRCAGGASTRQGGQGRCITAYASMRACIHSVCTPRAHRLARAMASESPARVCASLLTIRRPPVCRICIHACVHPPVKPARHPSVRLHPSVQTCTCSTSPPDLPAHHHSPPSPSLPAPPQSSVFISPAHRHGNVEKRRGIDAHAHVSGRALCRLESFGCALSRVRALSDLRYYIVLYCIVLYCIISIYSRALSRVRA